MLLCEQSVSCGYVNTMVLYVVMWIVGQIWLCKHCGSLCCYVNSKSDVVICTLWFFMLLCEQSVGCGYVNIMILYIVIWSVSQMWLYKHYDYLCCYVNSKSDAVMWTIWFFMLICDQSVRCGYVSTMVLSVCMWIFSQGWLCEHYGAFCFHVNSQSGGVMLKL